MKNGIYGITSTALALSLVLFAPAANAAPLLDTTIQGSVSADSQGGSDPAREGSQGTSSATGSSINVTTGIGDGPDDANQTGGQGKDSAGFHSSITHREAVKAEDDGTQVRVENAMDVDSNQALDSFATGLVRSDARMDSVEMDDSNMDVSYRHQARFLGVIPAPMIVKVYVDENGTVKVRYPWYSFLMATDMKQDDLESKLQADIAGMVDEGRGSDDSSAAMDGSASTSLTASMGTPSTSAQARLTSRTRARILERIQAAFASDASASARAS